MAKRKRSFNWTKPVTALMSILWVMFIPVIYYFAMGGKNGEYRLQHEKEPII